jgi:hypothetical protein
MNIAKVTAALNHFIQIADSTSGLFNATANLADFGDSDAATFIRSCYGFNLDELNLFRELVLKIVDVAAVTPPEPRNINTTIVAEEFNAIIRSDNSAVFRAIVDRGEFDSILHNMTADEQAAVKALCETFDEFAN